jgi:electron transport complex protein RnfG
MKNNIKNLSVFVCICTVITLLLALTNSLTAPIIEKNQNKAANEALLEIMPDGKGFEKLSLEEFKLPSTVTEVHKETSGKGYVITLTTSGYGNEMIIMCGVDSNGIVTGAVCLSSNETLGKEKTYGTNFTGKDSNGVNDVDTIGGATKTTAAYKNAVKDALNAAVILSGGSADIRTEEEILAENLATALPAGEGKFTKLFLVEVIDNVDAVYVADNGSGYVFVYGEAFVGALSDGTVVTQGVEDPEAVTNAVALINASEVTDIDLSAYPELEKTVVSAKKTATGNYIFEMKGPGYGINGGNDYHPASGEYIIVRVSLTADGKIIDCYTVSEEETDGIGDACADEDFYGQFVGKTENNYTEIDAISGATYTTDGYKKAVERAFNALNVLKGVE